MEIDKAGQADREQDASGSQSVERATALLMLVGKLHRFGAGLSELVQQSGMKAPTVRRLLVALMRAGLVEQDGETRRYYLGPESYVLGTIAADRFGIHQMAIGCLIRLADSSQDTAFLSVRRGDYAVCLHREDGTYPIRSHVLAAGDRHALGIGAGSLAMLAALPDAEVDRILEANGQIYTERYPRLQQSVMRESIAEARSRGWAINRGLTFPGSWGIGIAVRDIHGEPNAALSIAAIESRLGEERQTELGQLLTQEAHQLEIRLHNAATVRDGGKFLSDSKRLIGGNGNRKFAGQKRN